MLQSRDHKCIPEVAQETGLDMAIVPFRAFNGTSRIAVEKTNLKLRGNQPVR